MVTCRRCSSVLPEYARFCEYCGYMVREQENVQTALLESTRNALFVHTPGELSEGELLSVSHDQALFSWLSASSSEDETYDDALVTGIQHEQYQHGEHLQPQAVHGEHLQPQAVHGEH